MAMDEVVVLFKGKVNFKQHTNYPTQKKKQFSIKIYKTCDTRGHTSGMSVYFGERHKMKRTGCYSYT